MVSRRRRARAVQAILPWVVLGACDLLVGWMNFHAADDVQAVALALLIGGFAFGAYRPQRWWLFALLMFLAVPLSGGYADVVNHHPGLLKPAPLYESIIALVFPVVGALLGVGLRTLAGSSTEDRG